MIRALVAAVSAIGHLVECLDTGQPVDREAARAAILACPDLVGFIRDNPALFPARRDCRPVLQALDIDLDDSRLAELAASDRDGRTCNVLGDTVDLPGVGQVPEYNAPALRQRLVAAAQVIQDQREALARWEFLRADLAEFDGIEPEQVDDLVDLMMEEGSSFLRSQLN